MRERPRSGRNRMARTGILLTGALLLAACGAGAGGGDAAAGDGTGASCYEGETIDFIVAYGVGGGFDLIARAMAPHLEEQLGATVVVKNTTGAGGLVAASEVYSADPDGLTFGFFSGQGIAGAVLGGAPGASFDLGNFTYIARVSTDPRVLVASAASGFQTIEDARNAPEFTFASAGPGGSEHLDATVLFPALGINGRIVTGYDGSAATVLSVVSGDTNGSSSGVIQYLPSIESGEVVPLLVIDTEENPDLPDVPTLAEVDVDDAGRAILDAHAQVLAMGRTLMGPPGIPADCLEQLSGAIETTLEEPGFVADMEATGNQLSFLPGTEQREIVEDVLNAPPAYTDLLQQAY